MTVEIHRIRSDRFGDFRAGVAGLRIRVFRSYPYLYQGDPEYEARYLEAHDRSSDAIWILAIDAGRLVGASTGLPLADETSEFQAPFREAGLDPTRVFYFGESVLLPEYRGLGLGHRFFDEREDHARALGRFDLTAFAAIDRDPRDPRRPLDHRALDPFWTRRGYRRQAGLSFELSWREVGQTAETPHRLTFWTRPLDR